MPLCVVAVRRSPIPLSVPGCLMFLSFQFSEREARGSSHGKLCCGEPPPTATHPVPATAHTSATPAAARSRERAHPHADACACHTDHCENERRARGFQSARGKVVDEWDSEPAQNRPILLAGRSEISVFLGTVLTRGGSLDVMLPARCAAVLCDSAPHGPASMKRLAVELGGVNDAGPARASGFPRAA